MSSANWRPSCLGLNVLIVLTPLHIWQIDEQNKTDMGKLWIAINDIIYKTKSNKANLRDLKAATGL